MELLPPHPRNLALPSLNTNLNQIGHFDATSRILQVTSGRITMRVNVQDKNICEWDRTYRAQFKNQVSDPANIKSRTETKRKSCNTCSSSAVGSIVWTLAYLFLVFFGDLLQPVADRSAEGV